MSQSSAETWSQAWERPDVALITNHGYGGAHIPFGGAPDTGGQNLYVNTLAVKLDRLGYRVTIFARGGFPHFESERQRRDPEYLSEYVRYVFVPGGGGSFIRKEDIANALDEQFEWLDRFIRDEAAAAGCEPWDVYELVNSHYWDGAVLGTRLVERWRNDVVEQSMHRLLEGIVPAETLLAFSESRHWRAMGEVPGFHLGRLLIHEGGRSPAPIETQVRTAASRWVSGRGSDAGAGEPIVDDVLAKLAEHEGERDPALLRVIASHALGRAILAHTPDVDEDLRGALDRVDRHVWTPHSLGELKDYNYRNRSLELRRALKLCERRNHERMVCARTRAFAATSAKIAERLWTHYRVAVEDTFYFPPCVDGDVFRPYTPEEKETTYRYLAEVSGLSAETLARATIVFETSRMDQTKRKDLLLSAFALIAMRYDDLYVFIGGGPENEIFQSLQEQIDGSEALRGRAFLTRAIPDEHIGCMFSIADVYASASEMEGFGMSVSQAAAAGTPIASSDVIPFSIHHAPNEIELFAPGDVEGLARALRRLLDDPDRRQKLGEQLRARVAPLDWGHRTIEFIDYLRGAGFQIAEGKPEGRPDS